MYRNVSEWTAADVYLPVIEDETNDLNYFRGNIYKKAVLKYYIPERIADEPEYDILADGRKVYKDLPARKHQKKKSLKHPKNYCEGYLYSVLYPYSLKEDPSLRNFTMLPFAISL